MEDLIKKFIEEIARATGVVLQGLTPKEPQNSAPQAKEPQNTAPKHKAFQNRTPETKAPQSKAPQNGAQKKTAAPKDTPERKHLLKNKPSDEEIRQGLLRFKMEMLKVEPFYGDILMKVPLRESRDIPTAATNGKEISYNPDFFATLFEGERNYVLMHEVLHILLGHWKRKGERDPELWNIACDYVVNGLLDKMIMWMPYNFRKSGHAMQRPENGCFIERYNGEPVEEFYARLKKEVKEKGVKFYLDGKPISVSPKDLTTLKEISPAEAAMIEKAVREMIHDTVKRRGTGNSHVVPGAILECIKTKPLPWYKLLSDYLEERDDEESSYLTPERKYIHMDLIIPGIAKVEDELGEIWAFVDTSGSVGKDELNHFMTHLSHIASQFRCTFNVAFWDTEVTEVYRKVRNKEQLMNLTPHHSGGTDINCIYEYIRKERIKPKVMLILSDGYFGSLNEPAGRLESKTILVISEGGMEFDKKNGIGKLARL